MTLPGNPTFAISRILYRNPETFSRRNMMIRLAATRRYLAESAKP